MGDKELNWTDCQAAYHVGRLGTVSAAAEHLGVHRATIQRHIDALEKQLGAKLFQRHTKGYTLTEIGGALMDVAGDTQDRLKQLAGLAEKKEHHLSGEFVVTSVDFAMPMLAPIFEQFLCIHPDIEINFVSSSKRLRMEYGEAHVAFRAGTKPTEQDSVVQYFREVQYGLFASARYAERYGTPNSLEEFSDHKFFRFLGHGEAHPWHQWSNKYIPETNISLRTYSATALKHGLLSGLGIGLMPLDESIDNPELIQVMPNIGQWSEIFWIVTHVDLHRSPKVQAFLDLLKQLGYLPPPENANWKRATAPKSLS